MAPARNHADTLRGATRLAVVATTGITTVVEEMHTRLSPPGWKLLVPFAYAPIRGIAELVGFGIDRVLRELQPHLGDTTAPTGESAALIAALNGVVGDYLEESRNPLAIVMDARVPDGAPKSGRLLVLVHGSCMNDLQWHRRGHDHGEALARELGMTPVYIRYNSGRHISTNGRELAELLSRVVAEFPVPVEEISLLGHSMGGLVCRSACQVAEASNAPWRGKLRRLLCLGSPHHGSYLERGGNIADALLGATSYSAPIGRLARIRSAGVTDLRFGAISDEDWTSRDRFAWNRDAVRHVPLPKDVACFAIAGTTTGVLTAKLASDGLVAVDSALGRHTRVSRAIGFPEENCFVAPDTGHLDLLSRDVVYQQLRTFLAR